VAIKLAFSAKLTCCMHMWS